MALISVESKLASLEPADNITSFGDSGHGLLKLLTIFVSLYFLHKRHIKNVAMPTISARAIIMKMINSIYVQSRGLSEISSVLRSVSLVGVVDPLLFPIEKCKIDVI